MEGKLPVEEDLPNICQIKGTTEIKESGENVEKLLRIFGGIVFE